MNRRRIAQRRKLADKRFDSLTQGRLARVESMCQAALGREAARRAVGDARRRQLNGEL